MHDVATGGPIAEVRPQRAGQRGGVGHGVDPGEFLRDEAAQVLGLQFADGERPAGELPQQELAHDAQAPLARAGRKTPCVAHMRVIAAQFFGNGTGRRWRFRDDALQP